MDKLLGQITDRASRNGASDIERELGSAVEAITRRIRLADALHREVHEVLSTTLRMLPMALQRLHVAAGNYSLNRDREIWNLGAPDSDIAHAHIECEWANGKTDQASKHFYADGTSAWIPDSARQVEEEVPYRTMKIARWRWAGPVVPPPDGSVRIWRWWSAPGELRRLSDHGGDEDWVCLVPKEMTDDYLPFINSLGVCRVSEHSLADGRKVFIGAHA
jgi:hypothetical protein